LRIFGGRKDFSINQMGSWSDRRCLCVCRWVAFDLLVATEPPIFSDWSGVAQNALFFTYGCLAALVGDAAKQLGGWVTV
jgi:hypothetical protein